jgi:3-phenylpropionate/cinnamic acid dioxygenase small subunit
LLARVAAEIEIRNLIARIAQLADHGELDEYVSLFSEDASWEFPGAPRHGRVDILAGAQERRSQGVTGPGSATRHVITTLAVQVADAVTATADSYWLFWRDTTTTPVLFNMGHYHDTVRLVDGQWRITRRVITLG